MVNFHYTNLQLQHCSNEQERVRFLVAHQTEFQYPSIKDVLKIPVLLQNILQETFSNTSTTLRKEKMAGDMPEEFTLLIKQLLLGYPIPNMPNAGSDKKNEFDSSPSFLETVPRSRRWEVLLNILVTNQEKYDSPSKEDLKKVTSQPFNPCGTSTKLTPLITEKTFLSIHLIVEFAKTIPGFLILCVKDQELLLKMCHCEVFLLSTARKYDQETDSIFFANNGPFTIESFHNAYTIEFGNALFKFCQTMWCMQVDKAEYALLTAIVIFSSSPCLRQAKHVEKARSFYIDVLKDYTDINRPGSNHFFDLLNMLPSLRNLSHMYRKLYLSLEVDVKKLPPSLEEFLCGKNNI